jgi:hypothetical protein
MPSAKAPDITVDSRGSWWTLSTEGQSPSQTGLWKQADTAGKLLAFDVPARALGLTRADVPALMSWAQACLEGQVEATHASAETPETPETPETHETPEVEAHELTARVGTFTCTGEVVTRDGRLYVDFPLGAVPGDLPAPARHWLSATLAAARRLRMVRVETCSETRTIHARVDVTGAPPAWLGCLLDEAVLYLRAAVERLLPAITFLTTADVKCQALQPATPASTRKTKKTKKTNKEKKT